MPQDNNLGRQNDEQNRLTLASESSLILTVDSLTVKRGDVSNQGLDVLSEQSMTGTEDNWYDYIEVSPDSKRFIGDFTFTLPPEILYTDVESIAIHTNAIGEAKVDQRWLFKISDHFNSRWLTVGDNTEASNWVWHAQSLYIASPAEQFIDNQNQITVRFQSNNNYDVGNLDYLVVEAALDTNPDPDPDPGNGNGNGNGNDNDGNWWKPSPADALTWQWQLQGSIDHSFDVDVYDIDLFDTSAEEISQLQDEGRIVICYFSAGTYEGWREDWQQHFSFITNDSYNGNKPPFAGKMDDWDERWLDIRRIDLLGPIMKARLDLAKEKGCDAVEPDNMDAWTPDNAGAVNLSPALTGEDQIRYNKWLADEAHARGLSIGLKNDVDQLEELVDSYDWALNEQCFQYNECEGYSVFTQANKAVFGVEYQGNVSTICDKADQLSLFWMKKKLSLNAWRQGCEDY
jgi:hypothetical protein